jgi:hypothetical protein
MKSIKFNEAFKIVNPEYAYLKLTPNNSVRNNSTYKIARVITSIYKNAFQRIQAEERKLIKILGKEFTMGIKYKFQTMEKISYFIYMEKKRIEFYFIVPRQYLNLIEEKMGDVWSGITVEEVTNVPFFSNKAEKSQLVYDKEDALSLQVDRRDNELLKSTLNVTTVMEEGDKVGLFYNFIPTQQHGWRSKYKYTIDKINNFEPVDRDKGKVSYLLKYSMLILTSIMNEVLNVFVDEKKAEKHNIFEAILSKINKRQKELLPETHKKENAMIVKTQVLALSESKSTTRRYNNMKSLTQSFETVSGDNKLIPKKYKKYFNPESFSLNGAAINHMSDLESGSLISIPGREILEEYNFIDKVDTKETQVPEELREGKFLIGENTFRGNKQRAHLSTDFDFQFLSLILIGPNRAGKSTLIGNLGENAITHGECVVNFDFIGNCELSEEMSSLFPKEKTLNIVCDDPSKLQGFGYNEVEQSEDPFTRYANAKMQTAQLNTFVNSINNADQPLTTRMERYLQSAANIVFSQCGSFKNVFEVLMDHNKRHGFINAVPDELRNDLDECIDALYELDEMEMNKETKMQEVTGTRYSRIDGIIDRLNKLKANPFMEKMLKIGTENNINLVDEFQKSQLINIKIPETMFSTDEEKDVYTTYWATKIDLALKLRKSKFNDLYGHKEHRKYMTKVNLFIDELYQVQNTEVYLKSKFSRWPKFNIKVIISCHYLNQIRHLREELRSASASYMLIAGCDKKNFKELESELYPYTEWDLLNLKRFHSLNLIKISDGYGKFITRMPVPVKSK